LVHSEQDIVNKALNNKDITSSKFLNVNRR